VLLAVPSLAIVVGNPARALPQIIEGNRRNRGHAYLSQGGPFRPELTLRVPRWSFRNLLLGGFAVEEGGVAAAFGEAPYINGLGTLSG
jgi:hypothetical protein